VIELKRYGDIAIYIGHDCITNSNIVDVIIEVRIKTYNISTELKIISPHSIFLLLQAIVYTMLDNNEEAKNWWENFIESPYYQVMAKTKGFLSTNNILTHHLKTKKLKKLKCC